jgi:hypothetical protein
VVSFFEVVNVLLTNVGFLRKKGLIEGEVIENSKSSRRRSEANGKDSNNHKRKHEDEEPGLVLPFHSEDLGTILEKMKELEVYLFLLQLITKRTVERLKKSRGRELERDVVDLTED